MQHTVELLHSYANRGVLVDSNLLLLFFLGAYDRAQIRQNTGLATFTEEDFTLLVRMLDLCQPIITTPNILTEVSNLSNGVPELKRRAYFASFASRLVVLKEEYVASSTAVVNRWARFGLTDAGIAEIARNRYLVLTDDFRLSQALQSDGIDTLNFNHLRDLYRRQSN